MWQIDILRVTWERTIWEFPTLRQALDFMAVYPGEQIRAVFSCGEA